MKIPRDRRVAFPQVKELRMAEVELRGKDAAFDVKLSDEKYRALNTLLVEELRRAKRSRAAYLDDLGLIDFAWSLYEQQSQQGISRDTQRYGSADLTSPIGMEHVDTLQARATMALFNNLLWVVDGKDAESRKKAPTVELYMQWRQEEMRLQKVAKRAVQGAYVEDGNILEACELSEPITTTRLVKARVATDEFGNRLVDMKGLPVPMLDEQGAPVPADPGTEEWVEVKVKEDGGKRRVGATVRRRSMKDFVFLPSHAADEIEVWGHATRHWESVEEIRRGIERGYYQKPPRSGHDDIFDILGESNERNQEGIHDRKNLTVEHPVVNDKSEIELWRVQFWADLGDGLELFIAEVSEVHDCIIRLKRDWIGCWRTVYVNPYPCANSVYGYSLILTKLLTTIEEHTAWRNMNADRGTLNSNAPIMRLTGALWEPSVQPMGAGQIIDVNSMDELRPMPFEDVSAQALQKEQQCVSDAQRIVGINDIAVGQQSEKTRTLGENRLATQGSFLRTNDPLTQIQEALEELGGVIHKIEVQALKERDTPLPVPAQYAQRLELMQQSLAGGNQMAGDGADDENDGHLAGITADMIEGEYTFKPRGSVEDADPEYRLRKQSNLLGFLANIAKLNPAVQATLAHPNMAKVLMQMAVDEFKPRDPGPFLTIQQPQPPPELLAALAQAGGPGGPAGAPPGPPGPPQRPQGPRPAPNSPFAGPRAAGPPGGPPAAAPSGPGYGARVAQLAAASLPQTGAGAPPQ